jgi:energy-coupling factor transporter ATP-binding protein EcfA2
MQINKINKPKNDSFNNGFNIAVKAMVEKIFSTQGLGDIEYVMSSEKNMESERSDYFKKTKKKNSKESFSEIKHIPAGILGPCEKALLDSIKNSPFNFIIIAGALGSGKSTIINFITNYISTHIDCESCKEFENCNHHKYLFIKLDFVKLGGDIDDEDGIFNIFIQRLYLELKSRITEMFSNERIMPSLENKLTNEYKYKIPDAKWKDYFHDLIPIIKNKTWSRLSSHNKVQEIFNYIKKENENKDMMVKIDYLVQLLAAVREDFPAKLQGCLIMTFDNIDNLRANTQKRIATYLGSFSSTTDIITILPVRLTTYGKINNSVGNIQYTKFSHTGPLAIEIIKQRIKYYFDNENEYNSFNIDANVKRFLNFKLEQVLFFLSNKEGHRLTKAIEAFAGNSVRRGLVLAERMMMHSVYAFNDLNALKSCNGLIRSLILSTNRNSLMKIDDSYISNIFIDNSTKRNSFICLRILQILSKNKENRYTLFELINDLEIFHPFSKNSIIDSLNYLSNDHKRLIYFLSELNLEQAIFDDKASKHFEVEITYCGRMYLNTLINDLTYIQECFQAIDWSIDEFAVSIKEVDLNLQEYVNDLIEENTTSPTVEQFIKYLFQKPQNVLDLQLPSEVDITSHVNRLTGVRKVLRVLLMHDTLQMIKYRFSNKHDFNRPTAIKGLVVNKMIASLGASVYNILKKGDSPLTSEEFNAWYNLCLIGYEIEKIIIGDCSNSDLEGTLALFENK